MRLILFPIFLLASIVAVAQERSKAVLIDEFGSIQCDELLARVDNFFLQLHNQSGTKGYFVIRGGNPDVLNILRIEQLLRTAIIQRRYDRNQVRISRSGSTEPMKVEMYLVRSEADVTDLKIGDSDIRFLTNAIPFLISTEDDQICLPAPLAPISRELLESNADGQIFSVVNAPTAAKRKANLRRSIQALSAYPRFRIRFILRKTNYEANDYWFIGNPRSKKAFLRWLRKRVP